MPEIATWKLERLALGELPAPEEKALRDQAEGDPRLATALDDLAASDREILFVHPPAAVAAEVARRLAGHRRLRTLRLVAALAAPAMAVVMFALVVARPEPSAVPGTPVMAEVTRAKGTQGSLFAYRIRDGGAEPITDGAEVRARDALQLTYVSAGRDWGVVVSIDGLGAVTLHLPEEGARSARLEGGGEVTLPHAYELDEAPRFERFFLVTSTAPLNVSQVLDSARALAARPDAMTGELELPAGAEQTSLTLRKVSR